MPRISTLADKIGRRYKQKVRVIFMTETAPELAGRSLIRNVKVGWMDGLQQMNMFDMICEGSKINKLKNGSFLSSLFSSMYCS